MKNARVWLGLCALLAANVVLLMLQTVCSNWQWRHQVPGTYLVSEARYWIQGFIVFLPLLPILLLKFRHGRKILVAILAILVAHAACFLAKAHVPGTRRHRIVTACDWAVEAIRADYQGPKSDSEPFFSRYEYHPLARPCVLAHTTRVPYLLGGRASSLAGCGIKDIPDYIVDEPQRINRDWWCVADYEVLAERKFGDRDFIIYKRVK